MASLGLKLNCLKASARRFSGIPAHLPQRTRNFSSRIVYSHFSRDPSCGISFQTTSRAFSIWPLSKSAPVTTTPPPEPANFVEPLTSIPKAAENSASALSDVSISKESALDLAQSLPEGLDLAPPVELLSPEVVDAAVNASNLILPALQYGDLSALGLISWTPAGLIRWSFELINVSTGWPWFWTVIAGALFWRIALFPAVIKAAHFSSRLVLIQPKLKPVMERISGAKARGDIAEMQIAGKDMQKLYSSAGISPLGGMIGPVTQLPVAIGMFLALKKMCELPVPQMAHSGMEFLPDLTAVDPTGILAPIFAVSMFWQMTVAARDMDTKSQPGMAHVMNFMRFPGAPLFSIVMLWQPSGLVLSLIVASVASGLQSLLLRVPAVRRFFNILPVPQASGRQGLPSFKETWIYCKQYYRNKMDEARAQAEESVRKGPPRRRL